MSLGCSNWELKNIGSLDSSQYDKQLTITIQEAIEAGVDGASISVPLIRDIFHKFEKSIPDQKIATAVVGAINDGIGLVNGVINDAINPALKDFSSDYCTLKNDVNDIKSLIQLIQEALSGNLWSLIQVWLLDNFPWLNLTTVYYVLIIIAAVLILTVIGGLISVAKLFI
jgi:hypothetical protein